MPEWLKSLGVGAFATIGGGIAVALFTLDKLVGAGLVSVPIAVLIAILLAGGGSYWKLFDRAARLERGHLPRLIPVDVQHSDFGIFAPVYKQQREMARVDAVNIEWVNDPDHSSPNASAKNFRAIVQVYSAGNLIREFIARWADTNQPDAFGPVAPLSEISLGVGDRRLMHLAMRYRNDGATYLFDNGSYRHPLLRNPDYLLAPGAYRVFVRLRGDNVDASAELQLDVTPGIPELRLVESRSHPTQLPSRTVPRG
jgi:hypothetical protein